MSAPMLKPQDIVVLLKLHCWGSTAWTYNRLAQSLGMSASEVHTSLTRCQAAHLYDGEDRKILKSAFLEFLVHGVRYAFYTQPGQLVRGIPTAHSAAPLVNELVTSSSDVYVWSDPMGEVQGQAITPLHHAVPFAAQNDPELYALLSLTDALRVGRVREKNMAISELEKRLTSR